MKKTLTNIAPLFFFLLLTLPFLALLLLQGTQWYLESEVEERFKSEKEAMVVLPLAEVRWVKLGKELLVEGKLFDVKRYTINGSQLSANGFFDEEETSVAKLLASWQEEQKDGGLFQLFFLFQCLAASLLGIQIVPLFYRELQQFKHRLNVCLPAPFQVVLEQPPRY